MSETIAVVPETLTVRGLVFARDERSQSEAFRVVNGTREVSVSQRAEGGWLGNVVFYTAAAGFVSFQAAQAETAEECVEVALDKAQAGVDVLLAFLAGGPIGGAR